MEGGAWWAAVLGSHRVGYDWSDLATVASAYSWAFKKVRKSSKRKNVRGMKIVSCKFKLMLELPGGKEPILLTQGLKFFSLFNWLRIVFFLFFSKLFCSVTCIAEICTIIIVQFDLFNKWTPPCKLVRTPRNTFFYWHSRNLPCIPSNHCPPLQGKPLS